MRAMDTDSANRQDLDHLREAFDAFSKVSGDLQSSYGDLQRQVDLLHAELRTTNKLRVAEAQRSRQLAKNLTALLEALPGGVVMLDEGGVVREINDAAHDYLGRPLKDLEWTLVCRRAFASESDEQGDLTLRDGRKISLAQKAIEPGPGQVMLLTDVTEDRKLQELLNRHRRLAAMGEMAAALAHQIRTPLAAGLLYVSNVIDNDLGRDARGKMLTKATLCLRDLEQLINDMLHFARGASTGDAGIEVDDLLQSVRASIAPLLSAQQSLDIAEPNQGLRVCGNRESLAGALINLVNNALQHAGKSARVVVTVTTDGANIRFAVKDNGPGVPDEHAKQIFDPFFSSRPDGTGLGLAVVRSVARAHGGDIHLQRNANPGAEFVLTLPFESISRVLAEKDAAA